MRLVRLTILVVASLPLTVRAETIDSPPATTTSAVQTPALLDRLITENLRILTGNNEPTARVVGARELLTMSTPAAWDRLAGVLRNAADPVAQAAVCQAVADAAVRRPVLVPPLIDLLGSNTPSLRQSAAIALARYKDHQVIARLAEISRSATTPLAKRLGAIQALGAMGDDKHAIEMLVGLLDDTNPELVTAALDAIDDSSDVDLLDRPAARRWWEANRDLDDAQWLLRRNEQLRSRLRQADSAHHTLVARLVIALRGSYQAAPDKDKVRTLLELLNDPVAEVRGLGVELVDDLISDRRAVPREVAAQLATMIADSSAEVRRQATTVVGDLRDRTLSEPLIASLAKEPDSRVRAAIIGALGRIGGPASFKALVAALNDAAPAVTIEAALGLSALAEPEVAAPDISRAAADVLSSRYEKCGPHDVAVREALLAAMSRIGARSFRPTFLAALKGDNPPGLRQAAIRGVAATDDGGSAALIRPLLADSTPGVRLAAAEALGRCGRDEDDLRALAGRFDSSAETEATIRAKSWEGFLRITRQRPIEEALKWVERFERSNEAASISRAADLLTQIEQRLGEQNPIPPLRYDVLERLGDNQAGLGRATAAAALYEQALDGFAVTDVERARVNLRKAFCSLLAGRSYDAAFKLLDGSGPSGVVRSFSLDDESVVQQLENALDELIARPDAASARELARLTIARLAGPWRQWPADRKLALESVCKRATAMPTSRPTTSAASMLTTRRYTSD